MKPHGRAPGARTWKSSVATPGDLPLTGSAGEVRQVMDDGDGSPALYTWDDTGAPQWKKSGDPDASGLVTPIPIADGGTGATSLAGAQTALKIGLPASLTTTAQANLVAAINEVDANADAALAAANEADDTADAAQVDIDGHQADVANPHATTAAQVGAPTLATFNAHASRHQPGGADPMAVDAAAATGSLRTLGTGALQATAGDDSRLSDARTPTAHATSHKHGGSDEVATATAAANAIPKADGSAKLDTWVSDASLTAPGKIEIATAAEVVTATDATRAVSPSSLARGQASGVSSLDASSRNAQAPRLHTSAHIRAGDDIIDGDRLTVSFVPTNYTRDAAQAEAGDATDLTAHLAGVNTALGLRATTASLNDHLTDTTDAHDASAVSVVATPTNYTAGAAQVESHLAGVDTALGLRVSTTTFNDHSERHEAGGADEIDGDQIDIDFVPANYTPTDTAETNSAGELTAHLKGLDTKVGTLSVGASVPLQAGSSTATTVTATTDTLIAGLTITPGVAGDYQIHYALEAEAQAGGDTVVISIYKGGVQVANTELSKKDDSPAPVSGVAYVTGVTAVQAIEIRGRNTAAGKTSDIRQRNMTVERKA